MGHPEFYEPETLKRLQGEILSILDDFTAICDRYHLEYFGIAGTGSGAIRPRGFIPWDDDIDIAMPRKDFERLIKIVERTMGDKYLVLNGKNYPTYPLMTTRLVRRGTVFVEKVMKDVDCPFGIFLDLYVLDTVSDNPLLYQIQSWEAWFYSKLLILRSIPRPTLAQKGVKAELIWAVCRLAYQGMKLLRISPDGIRWRCEKACRRYRKQDTRRMAFLPDTSPYDEMLRNMYGDYMELPPVEKRKTHYPYRIEFSEENR